MKSLREELEQILLNSYVPKYLRNDVVNEIISKIEKRIDDLIEDVDELRPKKKYQETKNVLLHIKEMLK